ncbi:MAG: uroporphyrinogen decarboxylase family protein [Eubacteriales bacterium]|nr:uroporphyrinogen decarboxylase family protein [Eubacteriales bacterium]
MISKERFYSCLNYQGYDRPPTKFYGTPEITAELMKYFNTNNYIELLEILGDDFRQVEPRYIGPELKQFPDGSWEGLYGERYVNYPFAGGTYPEAIYLPYAEIEDMSELGGIRFPDADWYDYSGIQKECLKLQDYVVCTGDAGVPDFMNGIARCRGVEQVLIDIGLEDPVYIELVRRKFEFLYEKYSRVLSSAGGGIDVLCLGEDYGNQNGLMISPDFFDKYFAEYIREFISLAHKHGARAMLHSCGSCHDLITRLIDLGLDILEVIQVDAAKMDITKLHNEFYGKINFCGSISVQSTLPHGTPDQVRAEVQLRKKLFSSGGMIIAPTHDIQVGTPTENILAMYEEIGSLSK